jgi:hypothetical protein
MKRVKEYRDLNDSDVRAVETVIDAAPSKLFPARQFKLVHRSAGWKPSGSVATYCEESFGVVYAENNATFGNRYSVVADAFTRYEQVTGKKVVTC